MKKISTCLLLLLLSIQFANSKTNWTKIATLEGGRIDNYTITKSGKIFAFSKGYGIFMSNDNAESWKLVNDKLNWLNFDYSCSTSDKNGNETIFVLDHKNFLFKSNDEWKTWSQVTLPSNYAGYYFVGLFATGSDKLYVNITDDLNLVFLESYDNGVSFTETQVKGIVQEVVEFSDSSQFVYTFDRIYKKAKRDTDWNLYDFQVAGGFTRAKAGDAILINDEDDNGKNRIRVSEDRGNTWRNVQDNYVINSGIIRFFGVSSGLFYIYLYDDERTPEIYILAKGDSIWAKVADKLEGTMEKFGETSNGLLLSLGGGRGVQTSGDRGKIWTDKVKGMNGLALSTAVIFNKDNLVAGTYDRKLYRSEDGGLNWNKIDSLPTFLGTYPFSKPLLLEGDNALLPTNIGILYTSDFGKSWKKSVCPDSIEGKCFSIVKSKDGNLYSAGYNSIVKSTDMGLKWETVKSFPYQLGLLTENELGNLVIGTNEGIWVLDNSYNATKHYLDGVWSPFLYYTEKGVYSAFGLDMNEDLNLYRTYDDWLYVEEIPYSKDSINLIERQDMIMTYKRLQAGDYYVPSVNGVARLPHDEKKFYYDELVGDPVSFFNYGSTNDTIVAATMKGNIYIGSVVLTVEDVLEPNMNELEAYPNPATDFINIELKENLSDNINIVLYNQIGERASCFKYLVTEAHNGRKLRIDTESLSAGVYSYVIISGKNAISGRFVVNK